MGFTIPPDTKFGTINLSHCSSANDIADPTDLGNGFSVHLSQFLDLGTMMEARIGEDHAKHFRESNVILMASTPSATPTIRDEEWIRLDHRVHMMFYAILMHQIPRFRQGITAMGGRAAEDPLVLHVGIMDRYLWSPHVHLSGVSNATLIGASAVVPGIIAVYGDTQKHGRLRRGIRALTEGWRAENLLNRLHRFVRALDGLMNLPKSAGEDEFVRRLQTFARHRNLVNVAREVYRLRSVDEHLSDWPSNLSYVKPPDRDEFVARREYLVEAIAGFAYRTVLADMQLCQSFESEDAIDAFWAAGREDRIRVIDLDSEERRFDYSANSR